MSGPSVPFVRRLAGVVVMDGLLIVFLLLTWLAAQAIRDVLL